MEYGDFLYIGADGLSFIREEPVDFLDYLKWLSVDDFKSLEEHLISVFNQKEQFPVRSTPDDIIAGMIVTSENEFNKKTKTENYYICNAHAVLAVVRHIFTPEFISVLDFYEKRPETQFLVRNYQEILLWILRDVEDLTSLYAESMQSQQNQPNKKQDGQNGQQIQQNQNNPERQRLRVHSFIRNRYVHTASLYQVFRQGLFGSVSSHSFTDKEPSANIATIRQLIELRLRRAFGAMAFQDTLKHNAIEPLNMSILFNTLKQYSDQIHLDGIRLESLNRIYTWSNSFIHSGLGDYSWIPFYIEIVLKDLFFGHDIVDSRTGSYSWDINNGIRTTVSVIRSVWEDLIRLVNDGKDDETARYKLVILRTPECDLIPDNSGIAIEVATSRTTTNTSTNNATSENGNSIVNNNRNTKNSSSNKRKGDGKMASTSNVVKFTVSQPPEALSLKAKLAWLSLTRTGKQFVKTDDGHWLFFDNDLNKATIFCNDSNLVQCLEEITERHMAENKIGFLQQFCTAVPELINDAVADEMETVINALRPNVNGAPVAKQ